MASKGGSSNGIVAPKIRDSITGLIQPKLVYATASASTNASIGATTMATASASGNTYQFMPYIDQTALGSGCTGTTAINILVTWTDPNASGSNSPVAVSFSISGNGALGNSNYSTPVTFRAKASTTVSYSTTYSLGTNCTTGPTYQVYPVLEQIQ